MSFGILDLIVIGLIAVSAGFLVLVGLVNEELGPVAKLRGKTRLLLILALGAGVGAFTGKLVLVSVLSTSLIPFPRSESRIIASIDKSAPDKPAQFRLVELSGKQFFSKLHAPQIATPYNWVSLPETVPSPLNNPTTETKVKLGERLFNDPVLSFDQSISCASCHDLINSAGADGKSTAIGIADKRGSRNTPTVWNAAFQSVLFWDGRANSLEEQAKGPILNPFEMGMPSFAEVERRINQDASYRQDFSEAFGDVPITIDQITQAIAAYERTLITRDSPYDRYVGGDIQSMTEQQIKGMSLFEKVGCISCHFGPNFSAASVFDGSAPMRIFPAMPTPYESEFELLEPDSLSSNHIRTAWRVPSLRNVTLTGPWLHNGSIRELKDVVKIMSSAQLNWSGHYLVLSDKSKQLKEIDRPVLSDQQVDDIVAFLHALSSDRLVNARNHDLLSRAQ